MGRTSGGGPVWTPWTPILGSSGTAPNLGVGGSAQGMCRREGDTAELAFRFAFGASGTSKGTGVYRVIKTGGGLPWPAAPDWEDAGSSSYPGTAGGLNDASSGLGIASHDLCLWSIDNTGTGIDPLAQYLLAALGKNHGVVLGYLGADDPWSWDVNDQIWCTSFRYKIRPGY